MEENCNTDYSKIGNVKLFGFLFFTEESQIYILDELGRICLILINKGVFKNIKENEYYIINNLMFLSQDNNTLYYQYQTTNSTFFKIKKKDTNFLNKYAIIQMISLDEVNPQNNPKITIMNFPINEYSTCINILYKIQFICSEKKDDLSYYLENFKLEINHKSKIFNLFIYKGEINKINISYNDNYIYNNKVYELIYLAKDEKFLPKQVIVSGKTIKNFDKFNCTNRIRFNIMNIKKDENIYKYNDNYSSYEFIYLINENNQIKKYRVFNVLSKSQIIFKQYIIDNEFNNYLSNYWQTYVNNNTNNEKYDYKFYKNQLIEINLKFDNNRINELKNIKNIKLSFYDKNKLDNEEVFLYFRNYYFFIFLDILCGELHLYTCSQYYFLLLEKMKKYSNFN